jgi:hypothetical protein
MSIAQGPTAKRGPVRSLVRSNDLWRECSVFLTSTFYSLQETKVDVYIDGLASSWRYTDELRLR